MILETKGQLQGLHRTSRKEGSEVYKGDQQSEQIPAWLSRGAEIPPWPSVMEFIFDAED